MTTTGRLVSSPFASSVVEEHPRIAARPTVRIRCFTFAVPLSGDGEMTGSCLPVTIAASVLRTRELSYGRGCPLTRATPGRITDHATPDRLLLPRPAPDARGLRPEL